MKTLFAEPAMRKLGIVLAGGVALMVMQSAAVAGIENTKHNLSSTGGATNNRFTATNSTSEICAFCHTPHGADTTAPAPLWNRVMSSPSAYQTYAALGTSTLDGATAPVGSVSLACLSCHDGTQAMNTMINQPGSGGYNALGALQDGTWTAATSGTTVNTATGKLGANNGIALIGTDLQNDHPVGIQYAGGGYTSATNNSGTNATATATSTGDSDFVAPKFTAANGKTNFWVDTGTSGRQKTDLILYTRSDTTSYNNVAITGGAQPYVECASCHDPHVEDSGTRKTFLRISNSGSDLCLACHTK